MEVKEDEAPVFWPKSEVEEKRSEADEANMTKEKEV
jgi:hypothetical protein